MKNVLYFVSRICFAGKDFFYRFYNFYIVWIILKIHVFFIDDVEKDQNSINTIYGNVSVFHIYLYAHSLVYTQYTSSEHMAQAVSF